MRIPVNVRGGHNGGLRRLNLCLESELRRGMGSIGNMQGRETRNALGDRTNRRAEFTGHSSATSDGPPDFK